MTNTHLHPDYLLPADSRTRAIARSLYEQVREAPIYSPHGHCEPAWFADNEAFTDPYRVLVEPDHYLIRMMVSQGVPFGDLRCPDPAGGEAGDDSARKAWRIFARNYRLFLGTPSRLWLEHALHEVLRLPEALDEGSADAAFDFLAGQLAKPEYRPRALFEQFGVEFLATTDFACDPLAHHLVLAESGWPGRVVPTFRPDDVTDPAKPGFQDNVLRLGDMTGEDASSWSGFLRALKARRRAFIELGATATDHGVEDAATADLEAGEAAALFGKCMARKADAEASRLLRAQLMTEMARMSLDDGMVMQLHPGPIRDHHRGLAQRYGANIGFDIPVPTDYARALRPLLERYGTEKGLTLVLYTLDETAYGRELAPLAGAYPCLRLGAPWWFFDSPEGMIRFREQTTETAGIFNTAGFVDDTRAFFSIPARHDMARRIDARMLAQWVAEHRIGEGDARMLIDELACGRVCDTFRISR